MRHLLAAASAVLLVGCAAVSNAATLQQSCKAWEQAFKEDRAVEMQNGIDRASGLAYSAGESELALNMAGSGAALIVGDYEAFLQMSRTVNKTCEGVG